MTQPDHVPLQETDRVRPSTLLPPPAPWHLDRPGEQTTLLPPAGPGFGLAGPDTGYALKLARRFEGKLTLAEGEREDDAIAGAFAAAARRAARFGRAPVIYDLEWAFGLFGYLGQAPADLVEWRRAALRGVAHHYPDQRRIADAPSDEALALSPAQVLEKLGSWRNLLVV